MDRAEIKKIIEEVLEAQKEGVCPSCGHCSKCGRGNHPVYPWPNHPTTAPWTQPPITYWSGVGDDMRLHNASVSGGTLTGKAIDWN